jgi:hypothetical protein
VIPLKLYADRPATAVRQLLTDLFVAAWVAGWIWASMKLNDLVERLAVPGQKVEVAGGGMADNLADAANKVDRVPGVGNALAGQFDRAADAARALADAGRQQQEVVHDVAFALALALLVFPLGLVLFGWLPLRVRWMRRAGAAAALGSAGPAGRDLLALRALATQPLRRLATLGPDVAAAWRDGDPSTVDALAALELRGLGLRPRRPASGTGHIRQKSTPHKA